MTIAVAVAADAGVAAANIAGFAQDWRSSSIRGIERRGV